jgi:hypothetical protein
MKATPYILDDVWGIAFIVLVVFIIITIVDILRAVFKTVKLHPAGPGFESGAVFSEAARKRLEDNYQRIQGTLIFWKNKAAANGKLYNYSVVWSILSGVVLPVLIGEYDPEDAWAKYFLTVLSAWTGLIVAVNRSYSAEELFRSYRQCESDFYDLRRRMLDRPHTFGRTQEEQLDKYFELVEHIRKTGRDAETKHFPSAKT